MPDHRTILIAGPTAVGKSGVALLLAERLGGEIISVDSMQVYRGLDIGTAKPSRAERAAVPHHLLDVADLAEAFDAAQFVRLARAAEADIRTRGRVPILCGGTGLYFKAFLEGLGEAPPADPVLRAALEQTPLEELLRELAVLDPATYKRIDRNNPRRVVRAMEVIRLTGKPFSSQRAAWKNEAADAPSAIRNPQPAIRNPEALALGLTRSSADLRPRIDARVDAMFAGGLVRETEDLLRRGLENNRTAMQALGYRQVVEHLRGERSLPDTIEVIKARTRQFSRRQRTWFKRQMALTWLELEPKESAQTTVERLCTVGCIGLG
jgi:tRNA dimethylallyltransferase